MWTTFLWLSIGYGADIDTPHATPDHTMTPCHSVVGHPTPPYIMARKEDMIRREDAASLHSLQVPRAQTLLLCSTTSDPEWSRTCAEILSLEHRDRDAVAALLGMLNTRDLKDRLQTTISLSTPDIVCSTFATPPSPHLSPVFIGKGGEDLFGISSRNALPTDAPCAHGFWMSDYILRSDTWGAPIVWPTVHSLWMPYMSTYLY